MGAQPQTASPVRYAFKDQDRRDLTRQQANHIGKIPLLKPGHVLVVRGRTQTQVFHRRTQCWKLRGIARMVKENYARITGLRGCEACCNGQLELDQFTPTTPEVTA